MRRALLTLGLLLGATLAQAQTVRPSPYWLRLYLPIHPQLSPQGSTFNGGTVTGATTFYGPLTVDKSGGGGTTISLTGGSAGTVPSLVGFSSQTDGATFGTSVSTNVVSIFSGTLVANSATCIGWASSGTNSWGNADTCLRRGGAAAKIQMGADINGTGIDQTFTGPNGITGTDTTGGAMKHASGLGTGAGVSHPYEIDRQITKATGTTAQTYAPAMIVCPSKILSTTSATVQTIATITTTSTTAGGLEWIYTVIASNGTVLDSDAGDMNIAWNNNAGTVAVAASASLGDIQSNGSGTLTAAQTATAATNVISLKYTPTWTVIVPTVVTGFATFIIHSSADTIACQ